MLRPEINYLCLCLCLCLKTPRNNPTSLHNGPIYKILIFQHTNNGAIQNSKQEPKNSHSSVTLKNSFIVEDSCFIQDFCSVKDFLLFFQDFFLRSISTKCSSRFPAKFKISCSEKFLLRLKAFSPLPDFLLRSRFPAQFDKY
jgi:hypothetical protein